MGSKVSTKWVALVDALSTRAGPGFWGSMTHLPTNVCVGLFFVPGPVYTSLGEHMLGISAGVTQERIVCLWWTNFSLMVSGQAPSSLPCLDALVALSEALCSRS